MKVRFTFIEADDVSPNDIATILRTWLPPQASIELVAERILPPAVADEIAGDEPLAIEHQPRRRAAPKKPKPVARRAARQPAAASAPVKQTKAEAIVARVDAATRGDGYQQPISHRRSTRDAILDWLRAHKQGSVRDIADGTSLPYGTVFAAVRTLLAAGALQNHEGKNYRVDPDWGND